MCEYIIVIYMEINWLYHSLKTMMVVIDSIGINLDSRYLIFRNTIFIERLNMMVVQVDTTADLPLLRWSLVYDSTCGL